MTQPIQNFRIQERTLSTLHDQKNRGLLNLAPDRQRGLVWDDLRKYALIDSVMNRFPMGLVIFEVIPRTDEEGDLVQSYEVVDGQQRLSTLFEFLENRESWTDPSRNRTNYRFQRFTDLTVPAQDRVKAYEIPVALLENFDGDKIDELFLRVQFGMALKPGEMLRVVKSPLRETIRTVAVEPIFATVWGLKHVKRDQHFMLAASFLESVRKDNPFQRFEFAPLHRFLTSDQPNEAEIRTALANVRSTLKLTKEVIEEVYTAGSLVAKLANQSARLTKMLFACLYQLNKNYHLSGRQPALSNGLVEYLKYSQGGGPEGQEAPEYQAWRETLRTGRMDSDAVKLCVGIMANYLVNSADLRPVDERRNFTSSDRQNILQRANNRCQCRQCSHHLPESEACGTPLTAVNFHADHILPWSASGPTSLENGQALCSACNIRKKASISYIES